jgi:hypothetical protein
MADYSQDLQYLADHVTSALNIYAAIQVTPNQLIVAFTNQDYIFVSLEEQSNGLATLRLRTRDMAAAWQNVPAGFSQINESRGLFADMKKAAHPSLKKNCLWYIGYQIKETLGDRLKIAEVASYRNFKYRFEFTNQYSGIIQLTKDGKEYNRSHAEACIFALFNNEGQQMTEYMCTDECLLMLANMAMMKDKRAAAYVEQIMQWGGKAKVTHSYRLPTESMDEVKAALPNRYAVQLQITDKGFFIKVLTKGTDGTMYLMEDKELSSMEEVFAYTEKLINLPVADPSVVEQKYAAIMAQEDDSNN